MVTFPSIFATKGIRKRARMFDWTKLGLGKNLGLPEQYTMIAMMICKDMCPGVRIFEWPEKNIRIELAEGEGVSKGVIISGRTHRMWTDSEDNDKANMASRPLAGLKTFDRVFTSTDLVILGQQPFGPHFLNETLTPIKSIRLERNHLQAETAVSLPEWLADVSGDQLKALEMLAVPRQAFRDLNSLIELVQAYQGATSLKQLSMAIKYPQMHEHPRLSINEMYEAMEAIYTNLPSLEQVSMHVKHVPGVGKSACDWRDMEQIGIRLKRLSISYFNHPTADDKPLNMLYQIAKVVADDHLVEFMSHTGQWEQQGDKLTWGQYAAAVKAFRVYAKFSLQLHLCAMGQD